MALLLNVLLLIFSLFVKIEAQNSVGTGKNMKFVTFYIFVQTYFQIIACEDDVMCTGANEYCQSSSYLVSPMCNYGTCQCLPCYTTGDYSGYSHDPSNPCAPMEPLKVGDLCYGNYTEIIISINAECSSGVVTCKTGFIQSGDLCLRTGKGLMEGASCDVDADCSGEMHCDSNFICHCPNVKHKYDVLYGRCVLKDFGDHCKTDSDCQVAGSKWNGYTYTFGSCLYEKCTCSNTAMETTVSYVNPYTGLTQQKKICINKSGSKELTNGTSCTVDPILNSNLASVATCQKDFVCIQCSDESSGKCRKAQSQAPDAWTASGCLTIPKAPLPSGQWMLGWTPRDKMLAFIVNQTWPDYAAYRQCSNDDGCLKNEVCVMPSQCGRGFCLCDVPFYWNGTACIKGQVTTTTEMTTTTTTPTTTLPTTSTTSTTVTTTTSTTKTTPSTTLSTTTKLTPMFYYSKCKTINDCIRVGWGIQNAVEPNGLVCRNNGTSNHTYCLCVSDNYMWVEGTQQCRIRDYMDPCLKDSDCDNDLYVKRGVSGQKCISSNTCGCSAAYMPVRPAILWAAWGTSVPSYVLAPTINRTYCVLRSKNTENLAAGSNCTLRVFEQSDSKTKICQNGLTCLGCPLDMVQKEQVGTCVNFRKLFNLSKWSIISNSCLPFSLSWIKSRWRFQH